MIAIVWEFVIKPEAISAFERIYGPDGDWAAIFRQYPGYEGTTLLQDSQRPTRYLTIDHWQDLARFNQMRAGSQLEYARLDGVCEALTESERALGIFNTPERGQP